MEKTHYSVGKGPNKCTAKLLEVARFTSAEMQIYIYIFQYNDYNNHHFKYSIAEHFQYEKSTIYCLPLKTTCGCLWCSNVCAHSYFHKIQFWGFV